MRACPYMRWSDATGTDTLETKGLTMGLLDFLRKRTDDILVTRVLVCSIGDSSSKELTEDSALYRQYFQNVTVSQFASTDELIDELAGEYDIVHLFVAVDGNGQIGKSSVTGTKLIEKAALWETKLLWIANNNAPEGYINGFKPNGNKLNLVMTIDRGEHRFTNFLNKLLDEMKSGSSMPIAWNRIAPQIPGQVHPDAPQTIFWSGLGQVRFIRV
jgi:hypothetical protein